MQDLFQECVSSLLIRIERQYSINNVASAVMLILYGRSKSLPNNHYDENITSILKIVIDFMGKIIQELEYFCHKFTHTDWAHPTHKEQVRMQKVKSLFREFDIGFHPVRGKHIKAFHAALH